MEPDRPVTIDDIQLYIRSELNKCHSGLESAYDRFRNESIDDSFVRDFMMDHLIQIKIQTAIYDTLKEINENLGDPKIYCDDKYKNIQKDKWKYEKPRTVEQGKWLFGDEIKQQEQGATIITFDMKFCIVCNKNKNQRKVTHATCDDDKCIAKLINSIDEEVSEKLSELNLRKEFEPPYFRLPWKMETRNKLIELLKPYLEETEV
jgi:hypothetical protein